jgi:stage III sporulation protein AG
MIKLSKLLKTKGMGFILLAFAAGIILLLFPENKTKEENVSPTSVQYVYSLENSLEELLKNLCGHKCVVMISLEQGYSYTYATNEKLETLYGDSGLTSKNVSKEYVITSKDGNESLVILKENLPKVKGVAIVCKNGNETDREAIISVICSLFDISPENVGCVIG